MPDRDLMPVPLPNGRSGNTGFLSVYFSPRLLERGRLRNYPDWRNWATAVTTLTLRVRLNGAVIPYTIVSPPPDPAVWNAVFSPNTRVTGWRFIDRSAMSLKSYDEVGLLDTVNDVYVDVARTFPDEPPTAAQLLSRPGVADLLSGNPAKSAIPEAVAYTQPTGTPGKPVAPDYEFHQFLSILQSHPYLLRLLGVVVDLQITLPAAGNPTGVGVTTDWPARFGTAKSRLREINVEMQTTPDFRPLGNPDPKHNEQQAGWLKLGANYAVATSDSLVSAQQLDALSRGAKDSGEGALPPLKERGVSLQRVEHLDVILARFGRQKELEDKIQHQLNVGGGHVSFYGEDVTMGFRVDVHDFDVKPFRSVFHRQAAGPYDFPRNKALKVTPPPDEGWTTTVLSTDETERYTQKGEGYATPTATRRVRDSVFNWDGWSAAAPMPADIVDAVKNKAIPQPESTAPAGSPVQVNIAYEVVPGTLPRLRYGHTYEMRARAVDLAGNSPGPDELNPSGTTSPSALYGRTTPVAPPTVIRRGSHPVPGVGDLPGVLVIKSEYFQPDARVKPTDRVLFPPRVGQVLCELHALPKGGVDIGSYQLLVDRDAASVSDQTVIDPLSREMVVGTRKGRKIQPGEKNPKAVYLPDPPGMGAALNGLPGASGPLVVAFAGKWPELLAARLVVRAGGRSPAVRRGAGGATVIAWVPKAGVAAIDLSTGINPRFLDDFGMWDAAWKGQSGGLMRSAETGQLWMLSAPGSLTLVHAVRQPLLAPAIVSMTATRPAIGAMTIGLTGQITGNRASTDRVTFRAAYTDPVDPLDQPGPSEVSGHAPLGSIDVSGAAGAPAAAVTPPPPEDIDVSGLEPSLHDSKRHLMHVTAEAFSRFSSYFTEQRTFVFKKPLVVLSSKGVVAGSVQVSETRTGRAFKRGVDYTVDGPKGVLVRLRRGHIRSTTRVTVLFIPLPVSRGSTEDGGLPFDVSVPASLPPDSLVVREIVPAFALTATDTETLITRRRNGRVLRVFAERPWHSSGMGEELGVVLDSHPADVPESTRYGRDPIVAGPDVGTPALGDFPRAVSTQAGVDGSHDAAGHAVTYDAARQLWFADVEVAGGGGYRPFVRLALARFQPVAIPGAYISPIVYADPMRLGVDRTTEVEKAVGGIHVRVSGPDHEGMRGPNPIGPLRFNQVTATFQHADPTITDADLRWQDIGSPVLLTRTPSAGSTLWSKVLAFPVTPDPLRVVLEEYEPSVQDSGGTLTLQATAVFTEVVEIPTGWRT